MNLRFFSFLFFAFCIFFLDFIIFYEHFFLRFFVFTVIKIYEEKKQLIYY